MMRHFMPRAMNYRLNIIQYAPHRYGLQMSSSQTFLCRLVLLSTGMSRSRPISCSSSALASSMLEGKEGATQEGNTREARAEKGRKRKCSKLIKIQFNRTRKTNMG